MGAFSKRPYNLHRKRKKSNFSLEKKKAGDWRSNRRQSRLAKKGGCRRHGLGAASRESHARPERRGLYDSTGLRKSQVPTPIITETRETPCFARQASASMRSHEAARPPQIAPKREISAFLENTTGSKKPRSKKSKRYSLGVYALWRAEGLPLIGRVSAAVRVFYFPAV